MTNGHERRIWMRHKTGCMKKLKLFRVEVFIVHVLNEKNTVLAKREVG